VIVEGSSEYFSPINGCQPKKGNTMKRLDLPLSKLSVAQKLDLMETLWTDLIRDENKRGRCF